MSIKNTFVFFLFVSLFACKEKEDLHYPPDLGPLILSPYHVSAYVDSILVDAAYGYDPANNYYKSADSTFYISRNTNDNLTPNVNQSWHIFGNNINLDRIAYPITFWPPPFSSHSNRSGIVEFSFINFTERLSPNNSDSTLFSITLTNFIGDTLSGTFQGSLYKYNYDFADSIEHVTNGQFKILLSRI